ncbi:P-loop NTPase fold protein [Clostridium butyricum]|uniref:KAP family P-loop domain protein n=1 Tax=Clostridium butyricum E4 str. BoNT E BL5262 TaxID=632245 RepID=C4IL96_CLOBU|nr:P-loop NTPase fold protein [Clostridium butyricum]EDT76359.1 KAP family P-loop domain protein [Clostridium butyricum 5521]EEP52994.1 KAP family P-loop domain protein [Clostridium butyricum E4 str. BoNT E BL5262]NFL30704.1 NTPase KAP [Clostridium butyricum]NFS18033.1 NTPase KAP [Clostridium butyricum]
MSYIKKLDEKYSIIKILQYSLLLSVLVLVLDILDIPSKLIMKYGWQVSVVIGIGIIVYAFLFMLQLHIKDTLRLAYVNIIDCFLLIVLSTFMLYIIVSSCIKILNNYKIPCVTISTICAIVLLIFRWIKYEKNLKRSNEYKTNVVDLKSIYENTINRIDDTILVEEKDVEYDLIGRNRIINQVFDVICKCNPSEHFVISLEGKWGCGKTTIIKNVENKIVNYDKDIVIIDEFDPWTYSSKESMLYAMFDILLKKTGYKYSEMAIKQIIDNVGESIIGNYKKIGLVKSTLKHNNELRKIKNQINEYLTLSQKRVVFFIDNIDRTDSENIILLFKLVGNVFDFKRVTYVLAFDNDRVKKIFDRDLNIDYEYLKKVIQMQINVPKIDKDILHMVIGRCCYNLLKAYGESDSDVEKYKPVIECIVDNTIDLRDFKRLINSVLSVVFNKNIFLSKRDLFIIEYIRLYNLELYSSIYENRNYFISHDKMTDSSLYLTTLNSNEFNKNAKKYFDDLFSKNNNKSYLNLLKIAFPYVRKYDSNQDLIYNNVYYKDIEYDSISKDRRICSGKYFDLYFTYTQNDYLLIDKLVDRLVDILKTEENLEQLNTEFDILLDSINANYQVELFEKLELYINDFNPKTAFNIINMLYYSNKIDSSISFMRLGAWSRTTIIIWELLKKISDEDFDLFINKISQDYKKIGYIDKINYWFINDSEKQSKDERKVKWNDTENSMIKSVLEKKIDIYDDKYYLKHNIWAIYRANKNNNDIVKEYINQILSPKNIFRFLYDVMSVAQSKMYRYSISENNLNELTEVKNVDEMLKKAFPKTDDEKFVKEVYEDFRSGKKDIYVESGIWRDEEIKLKL